MIVPVRKLDFTGVEGKRLFVGLLAADAKNLRLIEVDSAQSIYLDARCLMAGKYQITAVGANQYFAVLGKGLNQLVRFMLSDEAGHSTQPGEINPMIARIVNQLAKHREVAMLGHRAVVSEDRRQLDGFVGRSYFVVSNFEVHDYFSMACEALRGNLKFYTASIHGRDMTAVYAAKSDTIKMNEVVLKQGAVIQNSETAGRAIRSACVVLDSVSRQWSVDRFYADTRVLHIRGAKLRDRMMQSADTLSGYQMSSEEISSAIAKARSRSLSPEALQAGRSKLVSRAERLGVSAELVDQILSSLTLDTRRAPTLFDIYTKCLLQAANTNLNRSMPLRQFAFSLVFGG